MKHILTMMLALNALAQSAEPVEKVTTETVNFAPGGSIQFIDSDGDLRIEGWDRPELELTVSRSMARYFDSKHPDEDAAQLGRIGVRIERRSESEIAIVTDRPHHGFGSPFKSGKDFSPRLPFGAHSGVTVAYNLRVPRNTNLNIRHHGGFILINGVIGDVHATNGDGDIVLSLPDSASYSIDARSKMGQVTSDFDGTGRVKHIIGDAFVKSAEPAARTLYLRCGFGGIAIKRVPPQP